MPSGEQRGPEGEQHFSRPAPVLSQPAAL
jgi:hypothetical protein